MLIPSPHPPFIGANFYNKPKTYLYNNAIYTCGEGHFDNQHGVFTQDGHLITAAAFFHKYPAEIKWQPISLNPIVAKNYPIIEEAFFAGMFNEQYGHFLTEFISRIWAYKEYNLKMPILVRTAHRTEELFNLCWAQDLLNLLDLKQSDFIIPSTPIRIKQLTIPDPLYAEQGFCYKHMVDFCHTIGNKAMASLSEESLIKNSNIYLSRSKLVCGTILVDNEKDLEEKLRELGFLIIHPQDYLIREQISFFRNNNITVGTVGSAFHTSIFSPAPQGVALNMKDCPDINFLTIDGVQNASIDYLSYSGTVVSTTPNGLYYHTKTIDNPEKLAKEIYDFVMHKRNNFCIPNMGKVSIAYKPDITFQKIKKEQENYLQIDTRNGFITEKTSPFSNDIILVTLRTKNQPDQNFLMVNSDTPLVINHPYLSSPIFPVSVERNKDKVAFYIKNVDKYFIASDDRKIVFETFLLDDFNFATEMKEGLKLLCSIMTAILDTNAHCNMEYYNNVYPDLINTVYDMKNSLHRSYMLTYGNSCKGFIPLGKPTGINKLDAIIITHRAGTGDIWIKGSIDTGINYTSAIEAITIKLNHLPQHYTIKYSILSKGEPWTDWANEGKTVGTKGKNIPIIGFSIKVFDQNQNELPCICYAKFNNDEIIHTYSNGALFSSPNQEALTAFAVYLNI